MKTAQIAPIAPQSAPTAPQTAPIAPPTAPQTAPPTAPQIDPIAPQSAPIARTTPPIAPQTAPIAPPPPALKNFVFKHPFTMLVAGPTSCGKTTWIRNMLEQASWIINPTPYKIIWFYKRWQPMYTEMQRNIPNIEFIEGIQTVSNDVRFPSLYIIDDLMADVTKNQNICELYTEGSHHRNLSVICLLQNLYYKGKENRTRR